jgi:hypothetical protein
MSEDRKQQEPQPDDALRREGEDTEGHRKFTVRDDQPAPEAGKKLVLREDEGDVEGHRK